MLHDLCWIPLRMFSLHFISKLLAKEYVGWEGFLGPCQVSLGSHVRTDIFLFIFTCGVSKGFLFFLVIVSGRIPWMFEWSAYSSWQIGWITCRVRSLASSHTTLATADICLNFNFGFFRLHLRNVLKFWCILLAKLVDLRDEPLVLLVVSVHVHSSFLLVALQLLLWNNLPNATNLFHNVESWNVRILSGNLWPRLK